jgi:hypothetical protein
MTDRTGSSSPGFPTHLWLGRVLARVTDSGKSSWYERDQPYPLRDFHELQDLASELEQWPAAFEQPE